MPERRHLLRILPLAAALLIPALPARAQQDPPAPATTQAPNPAPPAGGKAAQRPKLHDLSYDQMNPRQRQRLQQALAGPGKPPMEAAEAKRRWDGMSEAERRQTIRRAQAAMRQQRASGAQAAPQ